MTADLIMFTVEPDDAGRRIDVYLVERLANVTRSQLRRLFDAGSIVIDGVAPKTGYRIEAGDVIQVAIPPTASSPLTPVDIPLDIIFEDDALIVVNKPFGLVMHPGAGAQTETLVQGLLAHCGPHLSFLGENSRPGIVHRLDRDTSGVVVCAKTNTAHTHLAAQFEKKSNFRQYVALLDGYMNKVNTTVSNWMARDPSHRTKFKSWPTPEEAPTGARHAVSHFVCAETYQERLTKVSIQLETGRTHQIRVHAMNLGLGVVGDMTYHRPTQLPETFPYMIREELAKIRRQLLHARYLGFEHPISGKKMAFEAPLPPDFEHIMSLLAGYRDS